MSFTAANDSHTLKKAKKPTAAEDEDTWVRLSKPKRKKAEKPLLLNDEAELKQNFTPNLEDSKRTGGVKITDKFQDRYSRYVRDFIGTRNKDHPLGKDYTMQPNIKESSKKFKNQLKGRGNITKRMETDVKQRRARQMAKESENYYTFKPELQKKKSKRAIQGTSFQSRLKSDILGRQMKLKAAEEARKNVCCSFKPKLIAKGNFSKANMSFMERYISDTIQRDAKDRLRAEMLGLEPPSSRVTKQVASQWAKAEEQANKFNKSPDPKWLVGELLKLLQKKGVDISAIQEQLEKNGKTSAQATKNKNQEEKHDKGAKTTDSPIWGQSDSILQDFDDESNPERLVLLNSLQFKENMRVASKLDEKEKQWWRDREFAKAKLSEAWVKSDPKLLQGHTDAELSHTRLSRSSRSATNSKAPLEVSNLLASFGERNTKGSDPNAAASLRGALEEALALGELELNEI